MTYLTDEAEPTFVEPTEPVAKKNAPVTTAQLEKYKMQLRKYMDDEEEWISCGFFLNTIASKETLAVCCNNCASASGSHAILAGGRLVGLVPWVTKI